MWRENSRGFTMKVIHLGFVLVIVYSVDCQSNRSPLAGYDYILRSCTSTAELLRTHRKAGADDKMISTNNVAQSKRVKDAFSSLKEIMSLNGRGKKRRIEETPLKTISIRRAGKNHAPLPFMRKGLFPEIQAVSARQQKRQRDSEIIIIKPKD
ncbi:uncharacterized protein [Fopius arisanus]|uniref:Uncharacterized protein n=1 Tax=Fopius arisanus TaxID=64838 RepID=A0A9R1TA27_9HYME|nr:PREDICTED: uncharacterized protein LOC105268132 [Fopius arisanus]